MLLTKTVKRPRRRRSLSPAMISARLLDMELATVSALRSLQMDLENDPGVPAEIALREARAALRK
jgi:hypothetical protein